MAVVMIAGFAKELKQLKYNGEIQRPWKVILKVTVDP